VCVCAAHTTRAQLTPHSIHQTTKFPTRAADPQGASKHLPTLEDEYKRYRLEEAIDSTLEELNSKKNGKR
jgi:hypothetical protein